jgi:uncharacterized protein YkwD
VKIESLLQERAMFLFRFVHIMFLSLMLPYAALADCAKPANANDMAASVVAGINAARKANGLGALRTSSALATAAQSLACDNAARQGVSHVSSDGSQIQQRMRAVGYRFSAAAENTGRGFGSANNAVAWWMDSSGHRANILNSSVRDIGVGIAVSDTPDSKLHWVVNFGAKR